MGFVSQIKSLASNGIRELSAKNLERLLNIYPPYVGAGVKVTCNRDDYSSWTVTMNLTRLNKNYFGTHFGGSLYSMCDPFYLLILAKKMGPDYIVWDKAATVRFLKPGKGRVTAHFEISDEEVEALRKKVHGRGKQMPVYTVVVRDDEGRAVAEVDKTLYVRRKGNLSQ